MAPTLGYMMMRQRLSRVSSIILSTLILFYSTTNLFSAPKKQKKKSDYSVGQQMLANNQSAEAINYFKIALEKDKKDRDLYIFLAIAYEQQNSYIEAIEVLTQGIFVLGPDDQLYYNLGNCYFGLKNYGQAAQYYSFAINRNQEFSNAYLNRANANVHLVAYQDAIDDYTIFLQQQPEDAQREQIIKMIELLRRKKAEAENQKVIYYGGGGANGDGTLGGGQGVNGNGNGQGASGQGGNGSYYNGTDSSNTNLYGDQNNLSFDAFGNPINGKDGRDGKDGKDGIGANGVDGLNGTGASGNGYTDGSGGNGSGEKNGQGGSGGLAGDGYRYGDGASGNGNGQGNGQGGSGGLAGDGSRYGDGTGGNSNGEGGYGDPLGLDSSDYKPYGMDDLEGSNRGRRKSMSLEDILNSFGDAPKDTQNLNVTPDGAVEDVYELEFDLE